MKQTQKGFSPTLQRRNFKRNDLSFTQSLGRSLDSHESSYSQYEREKLVRWKPESNKFLQGTFEAQKRRRKCAYGQEFKNQARRAYQRRNKRVVDENYAFNPEYGERKELEIVCPLELLKEVLKQYMDFISDTFQAFTVLEECRKNQELMFLKFQYTKGYEISAKEEAEERIAYELMRDQLRHEYSMMRDEGRFRAHVKKSNLQNLIDYIETLKQQQELFKANLDAEFNEIGPLLCSLWFFIQQSNPSSLKSLANEWIFLNQFQKQRLQLKGSNFYLEILYKVRSEKLQSHLIELVSLREKRVPIQKWENELSKQFANEKEFKVYKHNLKVMEILDKDYLKVTDEEVIIEFFSRI